MTKTEPGMNPDRGLEGTADWCSAHQGGGHHIHITRVLEAFDGNDCFGMAPGKLLWSYRTSLIQGTKLIEDKRSAWPNNSMSPLRSRRKGIIANGSQRSLPRAVKHWVGLEPGMLIIVLNRRH